MRSRWRVTKPLRDRVGAGHPWIYDRALGPPGDVRTGELVTLVDERGPLATALADPTSPLRARVLDRDPDAACDDRWAGARAEAAAARRVRDPLLESCTGWRVIHGEADACPGLVIDVYAATAVVVFDGPAATAFWRTRLPAVLAGIERAGIALSHVWVRGERGSRHEGEAVRGDPPPEVVIAEDEARFAVDVRHGQKTGFFLDQRDNRRTVRRHAAGQSVLNLFCYTGGFSLHAALGGASRVTSVDLAAPAIAAIEKNLALSSLPAGDARAIAATLRRSSRAPQSGRTWDLVIVDPPSFAPSERAKPAALEAYQRLARPRSRSSSPAAGSRSRRARATSPRTTCSGSYRATCACARRGAAMRSPRAAGVPRGPIPEVPAV